MENHRSLSLRRSLFLLASPLLLTAGCSLDGAGEADPPLAAETTAESAAELRYCPETDPSYPTCGVEPDACSEATATLTASPSSIASGQSSTLHWSIQAPATCRTAATLAGQTVARNGSKVVTPLSNTGYQLKIGTKTLATTSVNVVLPGTVRINGSTADWRRLLVQAVGTPNTRVVLGNDVDMDMTGVENIYVREGVTLTSEAPPPVFTAYAFAATAAAPAVTAPAAPTAPAATTARTVSAGTLATAVPGTKVVGGSIFGDPPPARNARTLGPRLYTTSKPKPLFNLQCNSDHTLWADNVRFVGFRLQGPHFETEDGDDNLERGIQINSCLGVEIANMELSGFSGQAVYIVDPLLRQLNPDAVKIHDNYIHNNQHEGGNGYGVDVGLGAYARIDRNVFDFNRHAIAASGGPGTGYAADHNLILKGGGVHAKWYNEYTHLFDVHGDANCPDIPGNQHTWNCGNAGDQFWMTNNAFQFTNDHAIKLRGVPRIAANISGNVFAHDSVGDAVETKSSTHVNLGPNTADVDTFGDYGVCDFDGDGKDDLFLATGTSWWYSSGGKMSWTYLNSHTERLSQVGLGDFNGDKRCDVFAINTGTGAWEISSGGSSAWTALPGTYAGIPFSELKFGDFNGDKITDVFRRAPDGQWWAVSPGYYGWRALQSSSIPLQELRLADFDGDGITDVLRRSGSSWVISLGATGTWQPWSGLSDDPSKLFVANVDGQPGADVLRFVVTSSSTGRWDISSGGRTGWQTFAGSSALPSRAFVGNFDGANNADLMVIDSNRTSRILSAGQPAFTPYGLYAY